jgi:hypothetical protein
MLKDPLFKVFMMKVPEVQSCYCLKVLQCKVPTVQNTYWFKVRELDVAGIGYTWFDQIGLDLADLFRSGRVTSEYRLASVFCRDFEPVVIMSRQNF